MNKEHWLTGAKYDHDSKTVWTDAGLRINVTLTRSTGLRKYRESVNKFIADAINEKLEREKLTKSTE